MRNTPTPHDDSMSNDMDDVFDEKHSNASTTEGKNTVGTAPQSVEKPAQLYKVQTSRGGEGDNNCGIIALLKGLMLRSDDEQKEVIEQAFFERVKMTLTSTSAELKSFSQLLDANEKEINVVAKKFRVFCLDKLLTQEATGSRRKLRECKPAGRDAEERIDDYIERMKGSVYPLDSVVLEEIGRQLGLNVHMITSRAPVNKQFELNDAHKDAIVIYHEKNHYSLALTADDYTMHASLIRKPKSEFQCSELPNINYADYLDTEKFKKAFGSEIEIKNDDKDSEAYTVARIPLGADEKVKANADRIIRQLNKDTGIVAYKANREYGNSVTDLALVIVNEAMRQVSSGDDHATSLDIRLSYLNHITPADFARALQNAAHKLACKLPVKVFLQNQQIAGPAQSTDAMDVEDPKTQPENHQPGWISRPRNSFGGKSKSHYTPLNEENDEEFFSPSVEDKTVLDPIPSDDESSISGSDVAASQSNNSADKAADERISRPYSLLDDFRRKYSKITQKTNRDKAESGDIEMQDFSSRSNNP